jgi:hypothetical protein
MNVIKLKYDDLTESLFREITKAEKPILISDLAARLNQPVKVINEALSRMEMGGAPLRFHELPEGKAVSY